MNEHLPEPPSPMLRSLLHAAREDAPSREELAAVARGLPLHLERARLGGVPRRAPRRFAAPAAVCAVLALAAAFVLARRPAPQAPEITALTRASADWPAPVTSPPEPSAIASADPAPPSDVAPLLPAPASRSSVVRHPAVRAPSSPPAIAEVSDGGAPASSPASTGAPAAGGAPSKDEADLLERAAIVLERNPAEALRLANEHLAGFPAGELGEEREVIAVEALEELGRTDEAKARGARFLQQYPRSARRSLIESMLAR
jgi:hypothetical protein